MASFVSIFSTSNLKRSPRSVASGTLATTPSIAIVFCSHTCGSSSLIRHIAAPVAQHTPNKKAAVLTNNSFNHCGVYASFKNRNLTGRKGFAARSRATVDAQTNQIRLGSCAICCTFQAPKTNISATRIMA